MLWMICLSINKPSLAFNQYETLGYHSSLSIYSMLWVFAKSHQSCLTLSDPMDCTIRLLCPWDSPGKNACLITIFSSSGSSQSRDWTHISCCSCIAGRFFTTQPLGKQSQIMLITKYLVTSIIWIGLPLWLSGEESHLQCRKCRRYWFHPWVWKIHWRRKWQLVPVFLPGKFHGQRSLAVYTP